MQTPVLAVWAWPFGMNRHTPASVEMGRVGVPIGQGGEAGLGRLTSGQPLCPL